MASDSGEWAAAHILLHGFLDEEGLSVVAQFHLQLHRLPVDLDVDLGETREEVFRNHSGVIHSPTRPSNKEKPHS